MLKTQAALLHYYQLILLLPTEDLQAFIIKSLAELSRNWLRKAESSLKIQCIKQSRATFVGYKPIVNFLVSLSLSPIVMLFNKYRLSSRLYSILLMVSLGAYTELTTANESKPPALVIVLDASAVCGGK